MPVSFHEYYFYTLCLRAKVSVIAVRQDFKQDIRGKKIKNFDFIINTPNRVFLIDIKGSSRLNGDTKVSCEDIEAMRALKKLYGRKVTALFVFFWNDSKLYRSNNTLTSRFEIKAIDVNKYIGKKQKGWGNKYLRCEKDTLKNIWEFIPEFKNIISDEA